jgi:radical SAM protein with 4Fe4S-binding SPASM domain
LTTYPSDRFWISLDGPPEINDAQRGKGVFAKAVRGIDKLYALRQAKGLKEPQIGISTVITPTNYRYLEEFFFDALDISKLDCISLELQAYLTERDHHDYVGVLRREFVCDPAQFADIDAGLIARQVKRISEYCREHGKFINTYPKMITEENVRKYFSADWFSMSGVKKRCPFPWISAEINANGDVTSCHAFYDLTLGNVNEMSIQEIWQGEKYEQYRRYLRKHLLPICQSCCLFYNEKPPMSASV